MKIIRNKIKAIKNILFYFCLFVVAPNIALAGSVIEASASDNNGVYSLTVEMQLQGNADRIRTLLTDFNKMGLYNKSVVHSSRLYSLDAQTIVGRIEIKDCIFFFCSTLVQVQKIHTLPSGDLQVTIFPKLSDYRMGKSQWHIVSQPDGSTRLRIKAVMEPKIWIPPLIGPALVTDLLKERSIGMMENLEKLSQADTSVTQAESL